MNEQRIQEIRVVNDVDDAQVIRVRIRQNGLISRSKNRPSTDGTKRSIQTQEIYRSGEVVVLRAGVEPLVNSIRHSHHFIQQMKHAIRSLEIRRRYVRTVDHLILLERNGHAQGCRHHTFSR